jgi:hypothetical protein
MIQTQVELTKKQISGLKKISAKERKSIAELIRQGVDMILKINNAIISDEQRSRAIAVAGRFHSGYSNLSTRHDEHLIEVYEK